MRSRWVVLAMLVAVLAFVAAGCGGDDGGGSAEGSEDVTGDISIMAIWGGAEQESFQAVIDGFDGAVSERERHVHVRWRQPRAPPVERRRGRQPAGHRRDRPARSNGAVRRAGSDPADRRPARRDRRELRRIGRGRGSYRRHAVRADVQGRQQGDHLVQRRRLRGGWRRAAPNVGGAHGSGGDTQRRRHHALLGRCRRRLADHGHVRERLHPNRRCRDVRPAGQSRDRMDGPVREGRARGHGGDLRRLRESRRRHRRRLSRRTCRPRWRRCSATTPRRRWSSSATSLLAS